MDKVVSLSQIGLYNPRRQNSELSERLFVIRQKQFEMLMEAIADEEENSIPQHHIIIAQRGMGKTTMLHRIAIELHKPAYKDRFIPLAFPEEQYTVTNLGDFWLNCLDALADSMELEHYDANEVQQIDNRVKELSLHKDSEETASQAYKFLMKTCQTLKRRPVLLVDNIGLLFNRLSKNNQHSLRAVLSENGAPIILGAGVVILPSQTNNKANVVKAITEYEAPFYDYFQIHYLKKLTFDEFLDLIKNLASVTNSDISNINKERPRLQVLHQLTGGNPRTAVMLFKLIVNGFSTEINDDLEALLDEITPLYKARYEEISEQSQKIIATIALNWDAINLKKLSQQSGYANNQLSPQLKRLIEEGWIETTPAEKAKGNAYYISERFFNIWFIMRMSTRRQKQEIYCLSRFLEYFYGEELTDVAARFLQKKWEDINQSFLALALAKSKIDDKLKKPLRKKAYKTMIEHSLKDKININIVSDYIEIYDEGNEIIDALEQEQAYFQKAADGLAKLQSYLHNENWDWDGAENYFKDAISLDKNHFINWHCLGQIYLRSGKYNDAENAFKQAISLDENFANNWAFLGQIYTLLQKYNDAEIALEQAILLDKDNYVEWYCLGELYHYHLHKYEKAEGAYKKVLLLDEEKVFDTKYQLIYLYRDNLGKLEEAETLFNSIEKEIDLKSEDNLQIVYQFWLNKALFELYKHNEGNAKLFFNQILSIVYSELPSITSTTGKTYYLMEQVESNEYWWQFAGVIFKLNYEEWLLSVLQEETYDIIMSPYYTAIQALKIEKQDSKNGKKEAEIYLKNRAVEIAEPARMIIEKIRKYSPIEQIKTN